jgi:TonB family protein
MIWVSAMLLAMLSPAGAQVGPAEARPIMGQLGAIPPAFTRDNRELRTEVALIVTTEGYVKSVEVVEGSGSTPFDESVQRYFKKWRAVPAIDDKGQPYESRLQLGYGAVRSRPGEPARLPPSGKESEQSEKTLVLKDAERVRRMACKDFLWEYGIVSSAKAARSAPRDSLLQAPLVLFAFEAQPGAAELRQLNRRYDKLVRKVAGECQTRPEAPFWVDLMKPALLASLGQ